MGQLYNAFGFNTQEKLNGKVKEVIQTNWWADEVNGKVVKGKPYTMADRGKVPMNRDFKEEYNESGVTARCISYNDSGKVYMDIKVVSNGRKLERADYYMRDTIRGMAKYTYVGDLPFEIDGYAPGNDTIMMRIKFAYDQEGYIYKVRYYDKKGDQPSYTTYERTPDGQLAKIQSFNADDKLNFIVEYTYNDKGERIKGHEEYFTTPRVVDRTYKYEYDRKGNWTAMIMIQNNKPWVIRTREIKYY
jgi:hypothetical protein